MIRITDVIKFLRECNTVNTWRIEGSADLFQSQDNSRLLQPTFYVGLGKTAFNNLDDVRAGVRMQYQMQVVIIFGCATTFDDRTGKYAQGLVSDARAFLFRNMVGNRLPHYGLNGEKLETTDAYPTMPLEDDMLDMDRARYWHKFIFVIGGEVQPEDCWQPDRDPFNSVDVKINLADADPDTYVNAEALIGLNKEGA